MKILRIIATMNPKSGGPCQGIRNSIPVQKRAGIINEVVSLDCPDVKFLNEDEFKIYGMGPAIGPYAYCKNFQNWLAENLERFDVAIIHGLWLYNSYGTYKVWKGLKAKNRKVPKLFVMPHGMLDPYFQKAKSRRLKAIRNWIFWNIIEKRVVNGATGILFTCEQEKNLAKLTFHGYKPKRTINVGYGILKPPVKDQEDFSLFTEKCPGLNHHSYWLYLSRIHPKKGIDLLVKAYLKLKEKGYKLPHLVIAGPGLDSVYGKTIYEMADDNCIHFPGMLEGRVKWAAFNFCEAFILPSHQENYGIAVVEAMACKKPVLITDQVNIWREIKDGDGGLIENDTQVGVSNLLKRWTCLSKSDKTRMGLKAYVVYREKFSVEKTALKMTEFFGHGELQNGTSFLKNTEILKQENKADIPVN